jgi:hypothetical protein
VRNKGKVPSSSLRGGLIKISRRPAPYQSKAFGAGFDSGHWLNFNQKSSILF